MIYVPRLSLHTAYSLAVELLVKVNSSSNLSLYVWEVRAEVREMKMTRPSLIVVSICGLRQDVCLRVSLSVRPCVLLLSWRHVLCQWVETSELALGLLCTLVKLRRSLMFSKEVSSE